MKKIFFSYSFYLILVSFFGCHNKSEQVSLGEATATSKTIVTIGNATDTVEIRNEVTLTAIATYLLKSDVKANTTGYITSMRIRLGDRVAKGKIIFSLQTKEARALGNTINSLDKSFRFNGSTSVQSPTTGYVAMVNHQVGDYVQDGEVLANITDASSFGFILNLPYEYNALVNDGKTILINLPDGTSVGGYVAKRMPTVDSVSQTQKILLKVKNGDKVPENLIANITLNKNSAIGLSVPRASLVAEDTQSDFWVMKLINDSVAIKIKIVPGIQNQDWVQVKEGNIVAGDRVLTSGNYGMGDTASVQIQKR